MLLLESDAERRATLAGALQDAGMSVVAVDSICALEQWPDREIVITEASRYTPWWMQVGATHVVVLADTPEEGRMACARGATLWVPRFCTPDRLITAIQAMLAGGEHSIDRRRASEAAIQQQAWLFTRQDESIWFEVRTVPAGVDLLVLGPGRAGASHHFPTDASLSAFQRAYQHRLIAAGFSMHAVGDRRR